MAFLILSAMPLILLVAVCGACPALPKSALLCLTRGYTWRQAWNSLDPAAHLTRCVYVPAGERRRRRRSGGVNDPASQLRRLEFISGGLWERAHSPWVRTRLYSRPAIGIEAALTEINGRPSLTELFAQDADGRVCMTTTALESRGGQPGWIHSLHVEPTLPIRDALRLLDGLCREHELRPIPTGNRSARHLCEKLANRTRRWRLAREAEQFRASHLLGNLQTREDIGRRTQCLRMIDAELALDFADLYGERDARLRLMAIHATSDARMLIKAQDIARSAKARRRPGPFLQRLAEAESLIERLGACDAFRALLDQTEVRPGFTFLHRHPAEEFVDADFYIAGPGALAWWESVADARTEDDTAPASLPITPPAPRLAA